MTPEDAPEFGITEATRREVIFKMGFDPVVMLGVPLVGTPGPDDIVVCQPAPGPHTADAHIEHCSRCKHRIWVASTTVAEPMRVCIPCFRKDTNEHQ